MDDLINKYRPQMFEDVAGQESICSSIKKALTDKKGRSFILTGPSGVGKTTIARIMAAEVGAGTHGLSEFDAATRNGVDSVREITDVLQYAPLHGSVRVLVLDEAHALSKAAWQALLKSVEEPPPGVHWIFCTTEPGKIPDTIRTRCMCYELPPVGKDALYKVLRRVNKAEALNCSDEILDMLSRKAGGSVRRALSWLGQCYSCKTRGEAAGLIREAEDGGEAIELCRFLVKGGGSWEQAMSILVKLKETNPESIRIMVLNYFAAVAMKAKNPQAALAVIDAFEQPYPSQSGFAPVVLSLGRVLVG